MRQRSGTRLPGASAVPGEVGGRPGTNVVGKHPPGGAECQKARTGAAVVWWLSLTAGAVLVIPTVILLANRVIRLGLEIRRYARDISQQATSVGRNLESTSMLLMTRDLVKEARGNAIEYWNALGRAG